MSKLLENKRSALWLGGMFLLVLGFLAAAVLLPSTAPPPGHDAPDVQVPRMQNVPPANAPKLQLEVEKDDKSR